MQVYREGPAHPPLPLSRRPGAFVALAIAAALGIVALPAWWFAAGWLKLEDGGFAMYVLGGVSAAMALGFTLLGPRAVRARPAATIVIATLPAVPAVLGLLTFNAAMHRATLSAGSECNEAAWLARALAEAKCETDALCIFGSVISASAFVAASFALLGGAASIERLSTSETGRAWLAPLGLGVAAVFAPFVLRVVLHARGLESLPNAGTFAVLTILSCLAARNARHVRDWQDRDETVAWVRSVLAAAVTATAGVVLFDVASVWLSERSTLDRITFEGVSPTAQAEMLLDMTKQMRTTSRIAWLDGAFAFGLVASSLVGALRKPARSPLGASTFAALGGLVVVAGAAFGARTSSSVEARNAMSPVAVDVPSDIEVPRADPSQFISAGGVGPTLIVHEHGETAMDHPLQRADRQLNVLVDRRAKWGVVARAIIAELAKCRECYSRSTKPLPPIAFWIAPPHDVDIAALGEHAIFFRPRMPLLQAVLQQDMGTRNVLRPAETDDMGSVVTSILGASERPPSDDEGFGRGHWEPEFPVLEPPSGDWIAPITP